MTLVDLQARRQAATCFGRNLVVSAGAGAGKTSLLVERFLNALLFEEDAESRVVALTFTEKAAAEMRTRLVEALERIRDLASEDAESADHGHEAGRAYVHLRHEAGIGPETIYRRAHQAWLHLDSLRLSTIHGFCRDILARHPREASLAPNFEVDDGIELEILLEEVWPDLLAQRPRGDGDEARAWRAVLGRLDLPVLERVLFELCGERIPLDQIDLDQNHPEEIGSTWLIHRARELHDALAEAIERCDFDPKLALMRRSHQLVDWLSLYLEEGLGALQESLESRESLVELGRSASKTSKMDDEGFATIKELYDASRKLLKALRAFDATLGRSLLMSLIPAALEIRDRYARRGFVSFDGLLVKVRDLLRDHRAIREEEKGRFTRLMIDEFQDTDPLQYEIAFYLGEVSGECAGDAYGAKLDPGRLFIVGDAKQSIYRFRGADMAAYRRAVQTLTDQGAEILELETNFRSPDSILSPLNVLFAESMHDVEDIQPAYAPIVSGKGEGQPSAIEVWSVESGERATERRRAEGAAIASYIQQEVGEGKYHQVAILFRALTATPVYVRALRERNIPYVLEGGRTFYERPEISDLIGFLKIVANPEDQPALLATLRSPLGAVPDEQMLGFVQSGTRLGFDAEPDEKKFPDLARALRNVREFRERFVDRPVGDVIEAALRETPMLLSAAAAYEGAQRVANLRKLADMAARMSRERSLSLESTLVELEERFADRRAEPESPLADERLDAVRLLTVHKAKGLEFPIVILPDIAREATVGYPPEARVGWNVGLGALELNVERAAVTAGDVVRVMKDAECDAAEDLRLFYVATTRATERLILAHGSGSEEKRATRGRWLNTLRTWGYDPARPPEDDSRLMDGFVRHRYLSDVALETKRREDRSIGDPHLLAASFAQCAEAIAETGQARRRRPSELEGEAPKGGAVDSAGDDPEWARVVGTCVHYLLEFDEDPKGWRKPLRYVCAREAREASFEAAELEREVTAIVERWRASGSAKALLQHEILGREVPMLFEDGDVWYRGSIDLLYRDEQGVVVADYKTDRVRGDLQEAAKPHHAQLDLYARAVQKALRLEELPRRQILFVREGSSVWLS